jgi:hypothetical protein
VLKNVAFEEELSRLKLELPADSEGPLVDFLREKTGLIDVDASCREEVV